VEPDTADARGTVPFPARSAYPLALVGLLGVAVAAALAAYARVSPGDGRTIFTLGFSGMLPLKTWLTSGAAVLAVVQALSAARMWGRLPGAHGPAPAWVTPLHRWSGTTAFVLTLPVGFHCVWALGFADDSARTVVHSVAGCLFYGAFAAKMLALRVRGLPGWTVPLLGGVLVTLVAVLWFGAALWYLTRPGVPLT
jgi:hypothetical protein